ncbi:V-type ATPase subunit [[Eubacterium] cellulosolvens]
MKSPSTIYLVTRTHGMRTHLLTDENFKTMAKSKSLSEIVDQLLRSDYATEIGKLPSEQVDSSKLEMIFLKTLVERFFNLPKNAKGKGREFLESYVARIEIENLKRILRAKHTDAKIDGHKLIPLYREHTLINFPALLKAKDIEEATALLRETPYGSLTRRIDDYKRLGVTIILESYLDSIYFDKVWEKVEKLENKESIKKLVGEEIDLSNLQLILTLKMKEIASRQIEEMAIPISYRLRKTNIRRLAQGRLEDSPEALVGTPYVNTAIEILRKTDPTIELETILSKKLYRNALFALRNSSLEFGYVVAYLMMCEREARNLVTITTALDLGVTEENLLQRLFI